MKKIKFDIAALLAIDHPLFIPFHIKIKFTNIIIMQTHGYIFGNITGLFASVFC